MKLVGFQGRKGLVVLRVESSDYGLRDILDVFQRSPDGRFSGGLGFR